MADISKKQNLEQGAVILLLSTIIVKVIGALFKIPISSDYCLGDLGFGYFSAVYDLFTPVYMMAISGFPVAVSRLIADFNAKGLKENANRTFYVSLKTLSVIGVLGCVFLLICVIPFVRLTDMTVGSIYCLLAVIPSFFFCCIVSCYRGYYEGVLNMMPAAVSNIIEALGKLLLGFSFAFITVKITGKPALGAAAALTGITLGTFFSALYLFIKYKRDHKTCSFKTANTNDKEISKILIITAIPIVLSSLSGSLVTLIDTFTVRWQLGILVKENFDGLKSIYSAVIEEYNSASATHISAEQFPTLLYGIRSKAFTIYNIVPTFTTALGVSAVPVLASAFANGDRQQIIKSAKTILKFTSLIAFGAGAGLLGLSERIMTLLFSKGASAQVGGKMLLIFAVACIFSGLSVVLCSMLQALSVQNIALINVGIGMTAKLVLNLILCQNLKLNIYGSAISTLVAYFLIFVMNFTVLIKHTGNYSEIIKVFFKPFLAAVFCGFSAYYISLLGDGSLNTVCAIAVGGTVYIVILALTKAFSKSEIAIFLKKKA